MKFLKQETFKDGTVGDVYEKRWRGHRVRVQFIYEFSKDPHWDGDEPLDPGCECYDVTVSAFFLNGEAKGGASVCNSWIDPKTEGPRGSNYLYTVACDLLGEALYELAKDLVRNGHSCKNKICIVQGVLEA